MPPLTDRLQFVIAAHKLSCNRLYVMLEEALGLFFLPGPFPKLGPRPVVPVVAADQAPARSLGLARSLNPDP